MNIIKQLFCKHEYEFVRNIYGDEINHRDGKRSIWKCNKCGKYQYREFLYKEPLLSKLDKLYDEYYKNMYNNWCALRSDILNHMLNEMIDKANNGLCYADFVLFCEEKYNDKNYYEKWFDENKLKYECKLLNDKKCEEINQYEFHVRWQYK